MPFDAGSRASGKGLRNETASQSTPANEDQAMATKQDFTADEWAKIRSFCRRYERRPITEVEKKQMAHDIAVDLGGKQSIDDRLLDAVIRECWEVQNEDI